MEKPPDESEAKTTPAQKTESPPTSGVPLPTEKKSKWKRYWVGGAILLLIVVGVLITLQFIHRGLPDGLIQANGRVEGDSVSVARQVCWPHRKAFSARRGWGHQRAGAGCVGGYADSSQGLAGPCLCHCLGSTIEGCTNFSRCIKAGCASEH